MRDKILAHRGLWKERVEQNTLGSINAALVEGFGVEIDVRDQSGQLIISHDPPVNINYPKLEELAQLISNSELRKSQLLALNVKSDGFTKLLEPTSSKVFQISHFWFDMSFPESIQMRKAGYPVASRVSELEPFDKVLMKRTNSQYVWLDSFVNDWWSLELVSELTEIGLHTVIVSPELHGRDPEAVWSLFSKMAKGGLSVSICTDHPYDVEGLL